MHIKDHTEISSDIGLDYNSFGMDYAVCCVRWKLEILNSPFFAISYSCCLHSVCIMGNCRQSIYHREKL